jgi:hypothetical protein
MESRPPVEGAGHPPPAADATQNDVPPPSSFLFPLSLSLSPCPSLTKEKEKEKEERGKKKKEKVSGDNITSGCTRSLIP